MNRYMSPLYIINNYKSHWLLFGFFLYFFSWSGTYLIGHLLCNNSGCQLFKCVFLCIDEQHYILASGPLMPSGTKDKVSP